MSGRCHVAELKFMAVPFGAVALGTLKVGRSGGDRGGDSGFEALPACMSLSGAAGRRRGSGQLSRAQVFPALSPLPASCLPSEVAPPRGAANGELLLSQPPGRCPGDPCPSLPSGGWLVPALGQSPAPEALPW